MSADHQPQTSSRSWIFLVARWAAALDLGPHLRLGRGEEQMGGRAKESVLATALEAVLGVVYLEGGLDAGRRAIALLAVVCPARYAIVTGGSQALTVLLPTALCTLAVVPVSVWPGIRVVDRPSTWQELQLPLPLKSTKPAISSAVRVTIGAPSTPPLPAPARTKSNFELNGLISFERSRNERDCPQ